jgi:hypothetical protein
MTTLVFSLTFGSIGVGYFIYGKKQKKMVPMISGLGLCAVPYVLSSVAALTVVCAVLTALPRFIRE